MLGLLVVMIGHLIGWTNSKSSAELLIHCSSGYVSGPTKQFNQLVVSYSDLFFLASVTPSATPTAIATQVAAIRTNRNHAFRIPHIRLSTGGWVLPGASSTWVTAAGFNFSVYTDSDPGDATPSYPL